MPHFLTSILTQVAVALLEAVLVRLFIQLWKAFASGTGPATATA
ncbi:hypothetical protein ACWD4G_44670 [Streptomyces sp. NPDC002643]